jgi:YggT family protein
MRPSEDDMAPLIDFLAYVIWLYVLVVFAMAIISWLVAFNVINMHNNFVRSLVDILYRLTEPALRPIRRWLPDLGGIDISPIVLFLILMFIRNVVLLGWIRPAFTGES